MEIVGASFDLQQYCSSPKRSCFPQSRLLQRSSVHALSSHMAALFLFFIISLFLKRSVSAWLRFWSIIKAIPSHMFPLSYASCYKYFSAFCTFCHCSLCLVVLLWFIRSFSFSPFCFIFHPYSLCLYCDLYLCFEGACTRFPRFLVYSIKYLM